MRKGHNPNRNQKKLLVKNGYHQDDWLLVNTQPTQLTFRHKQKDDVITLMIV